MNAHRIIEWLTVVGTAGLMLLLKKQHLDAIHYNLFLTILLAWCLLVIVVFRILADRKRHESGGPG